MAAPAAGSPPILAYWSIRGVCGHLFSFFLPGSAVFLQVSSAFALAYIFIMKDIL